MRLTKKLLSFLHRVFDKDPHAFLALRLSYAGAMTWTVNDAVLTTQVAGGPGVNLTIDLTQYTISQLVSYLASQPGYSVLYVDGSMLSALSARVLLDNSSDIATSNGDHLYGYTNVLLSFMEAAASELKLAAAQITEMVKQMSTVSASAEWLDELGGYYGIPRIPAESDGSYGPRIIAEVLRPRGNNVALEAAIQQFTGQFAKVTDVVIYTSPTPAYNGAITYNGGSLYSSTAKPRYGLFDVQYGYDLLNGGDITQFTATVTQVVNRLRDAGTHLRALNLGGSLLTDSFTAPFDDGDNQPLLVSLPYTDTVTSPVDGGISMAAVISNFADSFTAPGDTSGLSLSVTYSTLYNGLRTYNGSVPYNSGGSSSATL